MDSVMKKVLLSLAFFAFFGTPAFAQDAPETPDTPKETPKEAPKDEPKKDEPQRERPNRGAAILKRLDKNGDGKVSKDEATGRFADNFDTLDKNKDGFITEDEIGGGNMGRERPNRGQQDRQPAGPSPFFKLLDTDDDGKISKDEAPAKLKEKFDEADGNKDGFIDDAELRGVLGADARGADGRPMRDRTPSDKPAEGDKPSDKAPEEKKPERDMGPSERDMEKGRRGGRDPMGSFDTDGDGMISKAEAKGPMLERFEQIDLNGDGKIDRTEMMGAGSGKVRDAIKNKLGKKAKN
ncbi:MAG: hypothetical protein KDB07_12040 [Planctomycetes bacterium]|nr:hypothetical protein [Planctomycetota bacterium]